MNLYFRSKLLEGNYRKFQKIYKEPLKGRPFKVRKNKLMNKLKFFSESLKNLRTIGTFTRSSKFACEKMVSYVDFENSKVIVELGAGDGVITKHIVEKMRKDAILLTFEVNEEFCKTIRNEIDDPRVKVIEDSAEKLPFYLEQYGCKEVDNIVSAIPFVSIPEKLGKKIINISKGTLKKGGRFIQIHYSLLVKSRYEEIFNNVEIHFEARNMPPAFVLECWD